MILRAEISYQRKNIVSEQSCYVWNWTNHFVQLRRQQLSSGWDWVHKKAFYIVVKLSACWSRLFTLCALRLQQQGEAVAGAEGRAGQQVELVATPSGRAGQEDPASGGAAQARPHQQGEKDGGWNDAMGSPLITTEKLKK